MNDLGFLLSMSVFFVGVASIAFWTTTLDRPKRKPHHPAPGE